MVLSRELSEFLNSLFFNKVLAIQGYKFIKAINKILYKKPDSEDYLSNKYLVN